MAEGTALCSVLGLTESVPTRSSLPCLRHRKNFAEGTKKVLFPFGKMPVQFEKILGSSDFLIVGSLVLHPFHSVAGNFHLEFSKTQL